MPIRISRRDKSLDRRQSVGGTDSIVLLAGNPEVSCTGRNRELRILCGSV